MNVWRIGRERKRGVEDEDEDVLAPEIGLLQLDEFCTYVLSTKLASGKVERCAYGTMRRRMRCIAVSGWVRVGRGRRLGRLGLLLWIVIVGVVSRLIIVRGIHG